MSAFMVWCLSGERGCGFVDEIVAGASWRSNSALVRWLCATLARFLLFCAFAVKESCKSL